MARKQRIVLGLNSGTSADGVDAVACEITGRGENMQANVLGHVHRKYASDIHDRILAIMAPAQTHTEEVCRLDSAIGGAFTVAARAIVKKLGLKRVDFIGSHGQTICHLPPGGGLANEEPQQRRKKTARLTVYGTMQLGDPAIIATRLGVPVVSHFRQADMAVGGQGAPLVPWTDWVLSKHTNRNRVIQNIGGIANLTWLPASGNLDNVVAFDTGPGNMVIDALVRHFSAGRQQFDKNGERAAKGTPNPVVLKELLNHPFLDRLPPKSCGREEFGETWVRSILTRHARRKMSADDWIATATRFTAMSLALAYGVFLTAKSKRYPPMNEIILCGGGAKNKTLVRELAQCVSFDGHFARTQIGTTNDYGVAIQAKEGLSFAMLAAACMDRVPANLPQVTGAKKRVVLGQVCEPIPAM